MFLLNRVVAGTVMVTVGLFGLVGCAGNPTPDESATPVVTQVPLNPIVVGTASPVATVPVQDSIVNVIFLGYGYPTVSEMETLTPDVQATPNPNSELVSDARVLALSFEYVNNISSPLQVTDFVFGETTVNSEPATHGVNDSALYAMLGAGAYPSVINTANPVINPGETGVWSLDVLIPPSLQDEKIFNVEQTITIAGETVVARFAVNVEKKNPTPTPTSNGK